MTHVFSRVVCCYITFASCSSITFAFSPPIATKAILISNDELYDNKNFIESSSLTPKQPMMITEEKKKEMNQNVSMNRTPALVSLMKRIYNPNTSNNRRNDGIGHGKSIQLTSMQLLAAAIAFAVAFTPLNNAEAAMSGGRIGGSFPSSSPRSTISRPAPSRSYSSPSSSSSSYSRGYSQGYSSGSISRPSVIVAPSIGYGGGYSPFTTPRIYSGAGYGGAAAISYARGPSFFDLLLVGGFFFAISQTFMKSSTVTDDITSFSAISSAPIGALGLGSEVVQLSVSLEVSDRDDLNSILSVLDRLSETARTDSRVGIQNLSSQVALEILRRHSSIVSACSSNKHFSDRNMALREFQKKSIKERSKFESETVSKYGGIDYGSSPLSSSILGDRSSNNSNSNDNKATMVVITLILAIDGDSTKLNKINNMSDVEQALQKIAANTKVDDCLQSAEILWTPEDRSETLNRRDVIADYPELRSI